MLQQSAEENPGEKAQAAVAHVKALLDAGRAALKSHNAEARTQVTRQLTPLLSNL